jgi:hypothetical protein
MGDSILIEPNERTREGVDWIQPAQHTVSGLFWTRQWSFAVLYKARNLLTS